MKPEESKTCTRAAWCLGMRTALVGVPENHTGTGLSVSRGWVGLDAEQPAGPPRLLGVYFKPRRGVPLVLEFCPWCRSKIRFDEEDAT